ncbi:hypothetical protein RB195_003296 [Necator americanus]|uniref:Uncharacterized protein n=1 Tax=Necator americanus TaxID=51031 RepID=A0ABR1DPD7_NECAM
MYDQFDLLSIITTVPIRETVFSIEEEAQIRALKDSELTKPSHCSSNRDGPSVALHIVCGGNDLDSAIAFININSYSNWAKIDSILCTHVITAMVCGIDRAMVRIALLGLAIRTPWQSAVMMRFKIMAEIPVLFFVILHWCIALPMIAPLMTSFNVTYDAKDTMEVLVPPSSLAVKLLCR